MPEQPRGARRRPELSQHFLRSRALAASLVSRSSLSNADLVVEIGPGRGVITREIARRVARVVAVEVDGALAGHLRRQLAAQTHVEVMTADFLRYELPGANYKVFGSIPFSITAAIIRRLTEASPPPRDAYLIVQYEAAEKLAGSPWAPETLRSLLLKPDWSVEIIGRLRRTDFEPPPAVDVAMLWLARRDRPLVARSEQPRYRAFIAAAFGRRGRTVRDGLRPFLTRRQVTRLATDLRFDVAAPPSALTFDQWLALHRFIEGLR